MKSVITQFFLLGAVLLWVGESYAQKSQTIDYTQYEISSDVISGLGDMQIDAKNYKLYYIDVEAIRAQMAGVSHREVAGSGFVAEIDFPQPNGTTRTYYARENSTIHPELAERFPMIRTYDANGNDGAFVKWDVTVHGLHAMIMTPGESTVFIDPVIKGNTDYYIVYYKKDFITNKVRDCSFNSDDNKLELDEELAPTVGETKTFGTCELRSYRLAVAATGEYTIFHGGTVADAQSAQATTMNRVNGVYERDMAITMSIVANNDNIIYTNTSTDPYSNGNTGAMIVENQSNVNAEIGSSNYDIGHVFGTNSGGLAGLGVVCSTQKARGVTGSGAPVNDPFDIDYVAHEMGHQFGANHTQNNDCNRNNSTAVEPGSASTIMGYAGICSPNVQNNSNDHFHGISLEEISDEILSSGHQCEAITALANSAPSILSTNGGATVPASTPFALTATATDPDGDPISFNWEQMDNDISTQPPTATSTGGPNFRSWPSSTNPTRYFPRLTAVANNGPFTWEKLSSVSRTMNFRVTVRDNAPGPGGCNDHEDVTVTVDGNSGPFVVTYPSALGIQWAETDAYNVQWDVANTDAAPVNCSTVDILLSTDGGATYPHILATGVANNGSYVVTCPNNTETNTARVMVISSAGTFFDVSDKNFKIVDEAFASTSELEHAQVQIFPNPTANNVVVSWEGEISSVELTNAAGLLLKHIDIKDQNEIEISLEDFANGMYFIQIDRDGIRSVHEVIKH